MDGLLSLHDTACLCRSERGLVCRVRKMPAPFPLIVELSREAAICHVLGVWRVRIRNTRLYFFDEKGTKVKGSRWTLTAQTSSCQDSRHVGIVHRGRRIICVVDKLFDASLDV